MKLFRIKARFTPTTRSGLIPAQGHASIHNAKTILDVQTIDIDDDHHIVRLINKNGIGHTSDGKYNEDYEFVFFIPTDKSESNHKTVNKLIDRLKLKEYIGKL